MKPIKVGVIGSYTVVIEGHLEATSKGYDRDRVIVEALEKAGIIEIIDLEQVKRKPAQAEPIPVPDFSVDPL